uniref:large ribosomal subunit protein eL39 isoform X1 n=1 Tax=Myxine glutinosa TaxID=7769 RepID=UPI0035901BBE
MAGAEEQYTYGETKFASLNRRLQYSSAEELLAKGLRYHKACYKDVTNKMHIDRAKARFEKGTTTGSAAEIRLKKRGRPSSSDLGESTSTSRRCSREQTFDALRCVICQEDRGSELHNVSTKNMGLQIRNIGQETSNDNLKVRLNSVISSPDPLQAMAEDMKYHLPCVVKAKRAIVKTEKQTETTNVNFGQVLSDLELIEIVETALNDTTENAVLNMNEIHVTYVNLLKEHDFPVSDNHSYKPYLKQLILDNIADVHFSRPSNKTKPEQILSTKLKDHMISSTITADSIKDDFKVLLRAAKILRKDIASSPAWKFNGTFADSKPPPMLNIFCKHAVMGTRKVGNSNREDSIGVSASLLAQHFVGAYKSDRQVSYEPRSEDGSFKQRFETPLSVGLALDIHKNTRSKALVEKLAHLDLAISYKKVMEIETSIANSVLKQMESTGGICLPPWLVQDTFVWFAMDNIDFLESTPCGMNTLHGTAIAIYQPVSPEKSPMIPPIELDRSSKAQTIHDAVGCKTLTCKKPAPEKRKSDCKLLTSKPETDKNKKTDMTWMIGCLNFEEEGEVDVKLTAPGTWGAFNSLLSSSSEKTNVALVPPLIRSPPTDYDTLYTGLMRAHNITTRVMGSEAITVMTLDLQLYDLAMKLWVEREDIRKQFLFRPGFAQDISHQTCPGKEAKAKQAHPTVDSHEDWKYHQVQLEAQTLETNKA